MSFSGIIFQKQEIFTRTPQGNLSEVTPEFLPGAALKDLTLTNLSVVLQELLPRVFFSENSSRFSFEKAEAAPRAFARVYP